MAIYVMLGKYSQDSIKNISTERTEKAQKMIREIGGEIISGYALLGKYDLVLILELPNPEQAMKTSVGLSKMLGISFITAPAVPMGDFDEIVEGI